MLPQPVHAAAQSPVYGKILIPAWRDEPEELAQGLHDAIVSEATFCRVQERFGVDRYGRKQRGHQGGSSIIVPELVLRGHLLCPACSGLLTGSTSRGNGGSYTYYHCHHCKETRFRNEEAHQAFSAYLDEVTIASEVEELYRHILGDLTQTEEMQRRKRLAALKKEQAQLEARLFKADEGFIEDRLAGDSYERLKVKYQDALQRIRVERAELEEAGEGFAGKTALYRRTSFEPWKSIPAGSF